MSAVDKSDPFAIISSFFSIDLGIDRVVFLSFSVWVKFMLLG